MSGRISVIGGVYRERCRLPDGSDEIRGSGGRAAAVISGLGVETHLHTAVDKEFEPSARSLAETFDFGISMTPVSQSLEFRYDHALAEPVVWPSIEAVERVEISVEADCALVFGMLEAEALVQATKVVYDPQNPTDPAPFRPIQPSRPEVAYVLNQAEVRHLGGEDDLRAAAKHILNALGASVVVVKCGVRGALVVEESQTIRISAYATDRVWPIGSGDVFAAVFASRWATSVGSSASRAAEIASKGAALYANDRVIPLARDQLLSPGPFAFPPISERDRATTALKYDVYLAGPFFNIAQRWLVEEARLALKGMGLSVFSPLHDVGIGEGEDVAPKDIDGLKSSRVVLALVDGLDAGTLFEIGYARSIGKPVVVLAESTRAEPLKMITGTNCEVVADFVTACHRTAWAAI